MRRLITLHIGRGLEQYRPSIRIGAFMSWLIGSDMLSPAHVDLPARHRVPLQLAALHPVDADALAARLHADGFAHPHIATNCAATINAIALACGEGELAIVSYGWAPPTHWDVDQMMAFWAARAEGSTLSPAAMLLKLGCWP